MVDANVLKVDDRVRINLGPGYKPLSGVVVALGPGNVLVRRDKTGYYDMVAADSLLVDGVKVETCSPPDAASISEHQFGVWFALTFLCSPTALKLPDSVRDATIELLASVGVDLPSDAQFYSGLSEAHHSAFPASDDEVIHDLASGGVSAWAQGAVMLLQRMNQDGRWDAAIGDLKLLIQTSEQKQSRALAEIHRSLGGLKLTYSEADPSDSE